MYYLLLALNIGLILLWLYLKGVEVYEKSLEEPIEEFWARQAKLHNIEEAMPHFHGKTDPYTVLEEAIQELEHYILEKMRHTHGGQEVGVYYDGQRVRSLTPEQKKKLFEENYTSATCVGIVLRNYAALPPHITPFNGKYLHKPPNLHRLITNLALNPKTKHMQEVMGYNDPSTAD